MEKIELLYERNIRDGIEHGEFFWNFLPQQGHIVVKTAEEIKNTFQNKMTNFFCHNFYVIGFSLSETLEYETDSQSYRVQPYNVILEQSYKLHRYKNCAYSKDTFFIAFSEGVIQQLNQHNADSLKFDFLHKYTVIPMNDMALQKSLIETIIAMRDDLSEELPPSIRMIRQCVRLLIVISIIIEQTKKNNPQNNVLTNTLKYKHDVFMKFCNLIDKYHTTRQGHEVNFYEKKLAISTTTLYLCAKKNAGLSPKIVIDLKIIETAKALLVGKRLNIDDAALDLGFSEKSHFSRFFKKHTGFTPKTFQKNFTEKTSLTSDIPAPTGPKTRQ